MEPGFYLLSVSQKKTQSLVPISIPISSLIGRTCQPIRSVNWYDLPGFPHASQDSLRVDFGFFLSLVGCPVYCVLRERKVLLRGLIKLDSVEKDLKRGCLFNYFFFFNFFSFIFFLSFSFFILFVSFFQPQPQPH